MLSRGSNPEIADYCESDVVNTYRGWFRYELFRGRLYAMAGFPMVELDLNLASDAGQIFFPIFGVISIQMHSHNGSEIEIATIGSEAAAGFHDRWRMVPQLSHAIVQAAGRFASIDAEAFERAIRPE